MYRFNILTTQQTIDILLQNLENINEELIESYYANQINMRQYKEILKGLSEDTGKYIETLLKNEVRQNEKERLQQFLNGTSFYDCG